MKSSNKMCPPSYTVQLLLFLLLSASSISVKNLEEKASGGNPAEEEATIFEETTEIEITVDRSYDH